MPARARFLSWVLLLVLVIFSNACGGMAGGFGSPAKEAAAPDM